MTYEVELKFPVSDPARLIPRLESLRAQRGESLRQCDTYFAHPQRDFAATDEALRIRSIVEPNSGEATCLTYKGPKIDPLSKTRREIEIPFAEGTAGQLAEMLKLLGFREVRTVVKIRVPYELEWETLSVELALDSVDGLGTFLELEVQADEAERESARDSLLRLAKHLGLDNSERRSYLCLLLERDVLNAETHNRKDSQR
jgi:adenylate cyclase class 2